MIKWLLLGLMLAVGLAGAAVAGPYEDGLAAYDKGDYATAITLLLPLANRGNLLAQHELGFAYLASLEKAQAVAWFRKAADEGFADAQTTLGLLYRDGQGVPQDYSQAVAWFRKAADQGNGLPSATWG